MGKPKHLSDNAPRDAQDDHTPLHTPLPPSRLCSHPSSSSRLKAFVFGLKFNLLGQQICEAFRVIVDQSVWVTANFSSTTEQSTLEERKEREREKERESGSDN